MTNNEKGSTFALKDTITYQLTIGDGTTLLDNIRVYDEMTDLQTLNTDSNSITITGSNAAIDTSTIVVWEDDGKYSTGNTPVFDFVLPQGTGNGPVVITYTTTIVDQPEGIFDWQWVGNTGKGGNTSDTTGGYVPYTPEPESLDKQATYPGTDGDGKVGF